MSRRFTIDEWVADPDVNTLTLGDRVVRVEPKVMELCVRLASCPGTVVTKAELLESVWPGVIVGDDALTRAISELRRALEDDARNPRFVETIPKRGYRLIAPVGQEADGPSESIADGSRLTFRRGTAMVAGALLALTAMVWWTSASRGTGLDPAARRGPALVLVAELEHATDQPELAGRVRAMVEDEVARVAGLSPMPAQRVAAVLARMRRSDTSPIEVDTAREIAARETGVAGVITGELGRTGDPFTLSLQLWSAAGDPLGRIVARGVTEDELARDLAGRSGAWDALVRQPADGAPPLPPVTTSSLAALRLFAQAVNIADANAGSVTGPWDTPIELLRRAVELDPDFAMAKVWLALVLQTADIGRLAYVGGEPAPLDVVHGLAESSLRQLAGLTEAERLFVEGAAASVLGRSEQAMAALEALQWTGSDLFHLRVRFLLVGLYYKQGRWPDSVAQVVELARLRPDDFDANAAAAVALVRLDRNTSRVGPFASRARALMTPAVTQRENSCWHAAWIEHLPVFEGWLTGDIESALAAQREITARLPGQVAHLRDALATTNGYFWLTLGRFEEARETFELVGHTGQRETNLAGLADLLDERDRMVAHLEAVGWTHSAANVALAGLLERADEILRQQTAGESERLLVRGLEAVAAGRFPEGTTRLQQAVDLWRGEAGRYFYTASLALADAWAEAGQPQQVVRVLEEAAAEAPAYAVPGLQAAWWIKVQVRLVGEYRRAGRVEDATVIEQQVRKLLSAADPDHPFLVALAAPVEQVSGHPQTP